jgi:signal transduction histidine kinase
MITIRPAFPLPERDLPEREHETYSGPIISFVLPTENLPWRRVTDDYETVPAGPATTTLRSVVGRLALVVRCAAITYIAVQVAIWYPFYTAHPWRFAGPAAAVAWAAAVIAYLHRHTPAPLFACADSAVYLAFALGGEGLMPPVIRGAAFSWLVISMSCQLLVPAWYAPAVYWVPLAVVAPVAYWVGAQAAGASIRTMMAAVSLLIVVAGIHSYGRRELYGRAVAADAALDQADRAAGEQYVALSVNIERREHERLLHDTVLNTLTALTRADGENVAEVVSRCRRDVALIEAALSDPDDQDPGDQDRAAPRGNLVAGIQAVAAEMRTRGLNVHVEITGDGTPAVPAPVAAAISNAAREALSNVAAHAGTPDAWVEVSLAGPDETGTPPDGIGTPPGRGRTPLAASAAAPGRLRVTVRDRGTGFDPARVDRARLGVRRSIVERTADCGGRASIWSAPGQGTTVSICWPETAETGQPGEAAPGGRLLAREGQPW